MTQQQPAQTVIGKRIQGVGFLILFAALVLFTIDLSLASVESIEVPLWAYLSIISTGVGLQFVGAAVPNMRFSTAGKAPQRPVKPAK